MRLLWDYFSIFFLWQPLEKGVWRFEIALGVFFIFPRESGDLRWLWDYFSIFFLVATLGKGNLEN